MLVSVSFLQLQHTVNKISASIHPIQKAAIISNENKTQVIADFKKLFISRPVVIKENEKNKIYF